jgi:methyl-accepting chemotaxis protein
MSQGTAVVNKGISSADRAGAALGEMVGISQRVMDMVRQISKSSEQQASAADQISKNVEGISSVTQETALAIQQIAAAADDLNRLTENLKHLVSQFHLDKPAKPGAQRVDVPGNGSNGNGQHRTGKRLGLDIEAAKNAHAMWRLKVAKLLSGENTMSEEELPTHKTCQLGKWYYSDGEKQFSQSSEFHQLGDAHEMLHNAVFEVVRALQRGEKEKAHAHADVVNEKSAEVMGLLDDLKNVKSSVNA